MRFIPYGRQFIDQYDVDSVIKVFKSAWLTQGPKIEEFEKLLADYCGVKYAVAVSSGTAALHLACLAAGLKKGDEAVTSPITFLATPNAVLYCGAKPIFADIDGDTVNINPDEIKKCINKKTKAILPVHFAGLPCEMERIYALAKKRNLVVIEDACHALGARYKTGGKWVKIGSCVHSQMTVFSFHPVKHITTGEGGAITTNDENYYKKLVALRSHGMHKDKKTANKGPWYYEMRELGFNYRITDIQCALGISQLGKLDSFLKRRREIVNIYNNERQGLDGIKLPGETNNALSAWHLYYIRLTRPGLISRRKDIFNLLRKNGVGAQIHYIPVYRQPYYKSIMQGKYPICPAAEGYYDSAITLPLYCGMADNEARSVIRVLKQIINERKQK